jgi:hypothetical protein
LTHHFFLAFQDNADLLVLVVQLDLQVQQVQQVLHLQLVQQVQSVQQVLQVLQ